mgnify:CR=1 FL=1
MLFVDEFCGILVYIKFGADVTSQYVDTVGKNKKAIAEYIRNQLQEDLAYEQMSIKELVDPFTGEPVKASKK